jgi:hypothetical protein
MNQFRINSTAFAEEDFLLLTDLTQQQIVDTLTPIILQEREEGVWYYNDDLVQKLQTEYPDNFILQSDYDIYTITL